MSGRRGATAAEAIGSERCPTARRLPVAGVCVIIDSRGGLARASGRRKAHIRLAARQWAHALKDSAR